MKRDRDGYNWDISTERSGYSLGVDAHVAYVGDERATYENWAGSLPTSTRFQLSDAVLALFSGWCWCIYGPMWRSSALEKLWPFEPWRVQLTCPVIDVQAITNESAMEKIRRDNYLGSAEGPSPADVERIVEGLLALGGKLI
jgi:hypothetical protein